MYRRARLASTIVLSILVLSTTNTTLVRALSQASANLVLNWYDQADPGFSLDNIHISNPNSSQAGATVTLGSTSKSVTIPPDGDTFVNFPGMHGGPVGIAAIGPPLVASQRVSYYSSFSEVYAVPCTSASTQLMLTWYDQASPGFIFDNIHLANACSGTSATATVTLGRNTKTVNLPAGGAAVVSFPGTAGGPLFITSNVPILASARTIYNQSFNEVNAVPVSAANTSLEFSWYDRLDAGFTLDNIHIGNPNSQSANVTVSLPGASSQTVTVPAQGVSYVNFGNSRSGPVTISSNIPVIASQRVFFYQSFSEVYANPPRSASTQLLLNWYDQKTPGFSYDNIHVANLNSFEMGAVINIGAPLPPPPTPCQPQNGCTTVDLPPGTEQVVGFSGLAGGPVFITAVGEPSGGFQTGPLFVSARTIYNSSFNEVNAVPIQ